MTGRARNLGIRGIDSIEFAVRDTRRSAWLYADRMGFHAEAASGPELESATGESALVFSAARIRFQCTAPKDKGSPAGRFLSRHPEGVRVITFLVDDLDAAWRRLEERGASLLDEPQGEPDCRWFAVATPLGDVEFRFVARAPVAQAPHAPGFDRLAPPPGAQEGANTRGFTHVDHVTSNTREIRSVTEWFRDVLGFERFWDIRFHTRDVQPDMQGGSGLNSVVVRDPDSGVKFATNEPLRPHYHASQVAKFVEDNRGPGVQHVALGTRAIAGTVAALRRSGLRFLGAPDAYYKMLPARLAERAVTELREDIDELRRNDILVDGERGRYLLQIFMQESAILHDDQAAGPFFHEVIQRRGHPGFGEGNFRALFESLERHQASPRRPAW